MFFVLTAKRTKGFTEGGLRIFLRKPKVCSGEREASFSGLENKSRKKNGDGVKREGGES
jgi:hypothetical protein